MRFSISQILMATFPAWVVKPGNVHEFSGGTSSLNALKERAQYALLVNPGGFQYVE